MKNIVLVFLLSSFVLFSCKKEKKEELDNQKPSITVNKPINNFVSKGGSDFEIDIVFKDNMNLSQYKLEIHSNFDGHTHGKTDGEATVPWEWDTIVNISGKEHQAKFKIKVPMNITAGNYHFLAMCTDAVGYEAPLNLVNFKAINLEDTVSPVLSISYPSLTSENVIQFLPTENEKIINFDGSITDNKRLKGVKIQFMEQGHGKTLHDEKIIYEYQNMNLNGTSFNLSNISLKLFREDLEHDQEYVLKIIAYDSVGNSTDKEAIIDIKLQ